MYRSSATKPGLTALKQEEARKEETIKGVASKKKADISAYGSLIILIADLRVTFMSTGML
jgi:hypothetical protein